MDGQAQIVERIGSQRTLAAALFVYFLADALFEGSKIVSFGVLTLMVFAGPLAAHIGRWHTLASVGFAVVMVSLGLTSGVTPVQGLFEIALVAGICFFGSLIRVIARRLFIETREVTSETLWASINVYVLIGFLFAFIYALAGEFSQDAFVGAVVAGDEPHDPVQTYLYFSFVTLTTLGYGDITPSGGVTYSLAYLESLIGQLYVAILIARLVSLYSSQTQE